jgi:serine/threonine-protein kinase
LSEPSPSLPRAFGKYVLVDRIGKGGMAEIFLARSTTGLGADLRVVVKLVLPELAALPRFADALVAEAKLAARLHHANVVQVIELGRTDDRLFIVMEYVEGLDLADVLRRCSRAKIPLPIDFSLLVVIETLRGLDHAHRRVGENGKPLGIVHRDVSPSNVLVSFEGEVKVCDFGIAHAAEEAQAGGAGLEGKAGYMSPEHARGEALDARADVFAAGILLWELLAGRRRYRAGEGESLLAVAMRAEYEDPPPRGLPKEDELVAIVRRALAPARDDRYPSAAAMLRDLETYVAGAGLIASPLRLGTWLRETLGPDVLAERRVREQASRSIAPPPDVPPKAAPPPVAPPPLPRRWPIAVAIVVVVAVAVVLLRHRLHLS